MPSVADIAASQPSFQTFQGSLRTQTPTHVKGSLGKFSFANEKGLPQAWKSLHRSKRVNFNVGQLENRRTCYPIQAVATLEPKYLVHHENVHLGYNDSEDKLSNFEDLEPAFDLSSSNTQIESSNEEIDGVDEREKLRRMRISKANKGHTPWNKGRKHSPETLLRIRERTKLAMQDPKVKMKLTTNGHAQCDETRVKIGAGVRMGWQRRREKLIIQELCLYEWQNSVAEASRRGYDGEEELQWNSYRISKEKLKEEWVDYCVERRKRSPRQSADRRAPKSAEQRRKISEAIAAKWADSVYRERVCSALHKYHGTPVGAESRPWKKPSGSTQSSTKSPERKVISYGEDSSINVVKLQSHRLKAKRSKAPKFKDPLAGSKLEMIKNIRAQRTTAETQKNEAIGRARLLIAKAEKAAKALEVAARTSPIARASLLETRKLIAEANQSLESIDMGPRRISSPVNNSSSAASNELLEKEPSVEPVHQSESYHRHVNGIWLLESNDSSELDLPDVQNYEDRIVRDSNIVGTSQISYACRTKQHNTTSHHGQLDLREESDKKLPINGTKILCLGVEANFKSTSGAKKWVRGRLVEAEGSE